MAVLEVTDWGRLDWAAAYERQRALVEQVKSGEVPDQLAFVEHPHVITRGRNAKDGHVLASPAVLERAGVSVYETNRGGDVTYHGPGQIVGYPILDLNRWKRDVHAYVRALEEAVIGALGEFGITGRRSEINTGVWVETAQGLAKICAIGVHISRWITSHGFALNHTTDLEYFRYIVPCGLTQPVTSMAELGVRAPRRAVEEALAGHLGRVFALTPQVLENAK